MPEIYVISDPHFRHNRILEFTDRPFSSLEEMEETMIDLWNNEVNSKDTVICLGDWGFKKEAYSITDRLNGFIRLVMGNHDYGDPKYLARYFHSVHGSFTKNEILFSHIPVIFDAYHHWKYMVHGHYHDSSENIKDHRYLNVNMDAMKIYSPIHIEQILLRLRSQEIEYRLRDSAEKP